MSRVKFSEWLKSGVLAESPQIDDRELPLKEFPIGKLSTETIARDYEMIYNDFISLEGIDPNRKIFIAISEKNKNIDIGYIDENEDRYKYLVAMRMSYRKPFNFSESSFNGKKCFQVSMVSGSEHSQGFGFASILYSAFVAHLDCYLFSDMLQHPGGQGVWLKIARNPLNLPVKVKVYDVTKNSFLQDDSGNDIVYDATNIRNRRIWGDDEIHKNVLLMLYIEE